MRRAPRVLRMAVVSQSSVKQFGEKRVFLAGTINYTVLIIIIYTKEKDQGTTSYAILSTNTRQCKQPLAHLGLQ